MDFADAVAAFSVYLLTARGRSRATVDSYASDLTQFAVLAKIELLPELTRAAVIAWLSAAAESEFAARSRARKLSALRSFVQWALEYGHLAADPIPAEVLNPKALYLPFALTEGEMNAVLKAAGCDDQPEMLTPVLLRDRAMLEVLYATGMRVSELCDLRMIALQLGEGFAVVTGKGNKQRLVPLGQPAITALNDYFDGARDEICPHAAGHNEVFLSRRGPVSRSFVFRRVQHYAQQAAIGREISPHTFRHSCASHMLAHGADLRTVQELLGHANLVTTQIYTHIEKSHLRAVFDQCHPLA